MLCPDCLGDECGGCKKGFVKQERRPVALIGPEGDALFQAYKWLRNYGTLLAPGGLQDQSAAFVDAVEWCDAVHSAYSRAVGKRNAELAKVQAGLQKMIGSHANRKR
jgi:hypothetical protein